MEKQELIDLSEKILEDIEMGTIPISQICFKCLRLARLLEDEKGIKFFMAETSGYPRDEKSGLVLGDYWNIGYNIAGRGFVNDNNERVIFTETLLELEELVEASKTVISSASDPNVSISSSNPYQHVIAPVGNKAERSKHFELIKKNLSKISKIKGAVYRYILNINGRLKNDSVYMKLLEKNHKKTVSKLTKICPDLIIEFDSIYNNIDSNNSVDLENCVHTCRRILKSIADYLYPVDNTKKEIQLEGTNLKVGEEQYVNRLLAFISSKSNSKTYSKIVGSTLQDINNRMHALYGATCKGTHTELSNFEVERYVLYTYIFLDDISNLLD